MQILHSIKLIMTNIIMVFVSLVTVVIIADPAAPSLAIKSANDWLAQCDKWDDWDKPGPAYRVYGNTYYVGTCGIGAVLITGDNGHILIDGGTEKGALVIANNIQSLGVKLTDIKYIVFSHEHVDHVAGIAHLQKISGAELVSSSAAEEVLNTGLSSSEDPQAGMFEPFPAAKVNRLIHSGEKLILDNLAIKAIATPGHTLGAMSWRWQSCEEEACYNIVYADSLSPISNDSYLFSGHPDLVVNYRIGLEKLSRLSCDILITPHPSSSKMHSRLSEHNSLLAEDGCIDYADKINTRLNERLAKEHNQSKPETSM